MAWNGYFSVDGAEFINTTRTETYAQNAGLAWFYPVYDNDALPYMLGDGLKYHTPLIDNAPWTDPDQPESYDFFGFYPLDVTGIEDSTRQSTVVESTLDGGVPGRLRHATKAVNFNGLLVARTTAGAEYGMRWLKAALKGGPCDTGTASSKSFGSDLCYLSIEPDMDLPQFGEGAVQAVVDGGYHGVSVDTPVLDGGHAPDQSGYLLDGGTATITEGVVYQSDPLFRIPLPDPGTPEDCLDPYRRSLKRFLVNSGPFISSKKEPSNGGAVWAVTFTGVAGNPFEFGVEVPIIKGFLDPAVTDPAAPGVEGVEFDPVGGTYTDEPCTPQIFEPLFNPACPALVAPPGPPDIAMGCFTPPANWRRRMVKLPEAYIPLWGDSLPVVEVYARDADVNNMRLRFYAAPFGSDLSEDPCAYCGDIVMSYIPHGSTMVFDAAEQTVHVERPGGAVQRADSLVFDTDGKPFTWPSLTCGFDYIVTVDLPQTQVPPVLDISLVARAS